MKRINVSSGRPLEAKAHYSRALRVGDTVLQSGTTAIDPSGQVIGEGDVERQVEAIFGIAEESMGAADGRFDDVVSARLYVVDGADADAACRRTAGLLGAAQPTLSVVPVRALARPTQLIEIELEAVDGAATGAIRCHRGSAAEDAYSACSALRMGDRIWCSGAVGFGASNLGADLEGQVAEAIEWVGGLFEELGGGLGDVLCNRVSLADLGGLSSFRVARSRALAGVRPASTLVATPPFATPGQLFELEVEGVVGAADTRREWFAAHGLDRPAGFAGAVAAGERIYVSGCVALDREARVTAPDDWATQIDSCIAQIRDLLEAAGSSLADVVQRRTFTTGGATMNRAYGEGPAWFEANRPAALGCRIDALVHPDLVVEVDAIAVRGAGEGIEWRSLANTTSNATS